jgi:transposase
LKIRDVSIKDLVFLDEAGVNLALIRLYARAPRGQRARGSRPHQRGKNVSMIGAISLERIITNLNLSGSIDGLTFEAFVIRKLIPKLWKGAVVIWDNYSIHKGKEIEKAIKKAGAKLIYLPPYSPDFNPIENCWSKIKSVLRSIGARTYQDLENAITLRVPYGSHLPILKYLPKIFVIGLPTPVIVSHHFENRYNCYAYYLLHLISFITSNLS